MRLGALAAGNGADISNNAPAPRTTPEVATP